MYCVCVSLSVENDSPLTVYGSGSPLRQFIYSKVCVFVCMYIVCVLRLCGCYMYM